jgi:hypothetical protein
MKILVVAPGLINFSQIARVQFQVKQSLFCGGCLRVFSGQLGCLRPSTHRGHTRVQFRPIVALV